MDKKSLKEIILQKIESKNEDAFSNFLQTVVEHLKENQTLKLNDIGYFQLRTEPLSRMERRGEAIDKKNILVFLPLDDGAPIPLEINPVQESSSEFDESVFDIGINKSTIISDAEADSNTELKITELIESGEVLDNLDIMDNTPSFSPPDDTEESISDFDTAEIFDDELYESTDPNEVTEAEINKDFLNDSEMEESKSDNSLAGNGIETFEDNKEQKNTNEKSSDEADELETHDDEKNPFDELEDYISDDDSKKSSDVEEENAPETKVDEDIRESDKTDKEGESAKISSYSAIRDKHGQGTSKRPVLWIIGGGIFIIFLILLYSMVSSKHGKAPVNIANKIDTTVVKGEENKEADVEAAKRVNKKLNEKNNPRETKANKVVKSESQQKNKSVVKTEFTGLYRDIPNDRSITNRIYFDGKRYTVQASSWRSSTIAEHEVKKLRKRGFDAFIFKYYIKSKKGTWNRVRIGYFNTKKEAEDFLRKNKI